MFNFQWRTPCLPAVLCDFSIIAGGALLLVLPQGRFAERMARVSIASADLAQD